MKTIGTRLALAFLCVMVFLLLQGAYAIYNTHQISSLQHHAMDQAMAIHSVQGKLSHARVLIARILTTMNPDEMDVRRAEYEKLMTEIMANVQRLNLDATPFEKCQVTYQEIMDLQYDFSMEDAKSLFNAKSRDEYDSLLAMLSRLTAKMDSEVHNEVQQANRRSMQTSGYLNASALVVAIIWAIVLRRSLTDRRQAEKKLLASEERYRTIVDTAGEGVWIVDESGLTQFANQQMGEILGCGVDDMLGKPVYDFLFPEDVETARARMHAMKMEGGQQFDVRMRKCDGSEVRAIMSARPRWDAEGKLQGWLAMFTDVTERYHAEENRRRLEGRIQHAQKLESLGVLAGGIAHDFNNLLMAILGNADLALQDLSDVAPARPSVLEIEHAARRAADLCKQMLAYSGKGRFELRHMNLSDVVSEMAHMLEVTISKKAVLRYLFPKSLPSVEADPTQMRQVVMNLITNASEAIGDKSGLITVATGAMHCDPDYFKTTYFTEDLAAGLYVYIEVSDTGCGMDAATVARVFDPFYTTKFTGRGLGLAAVLGIVRGHHGAVKIYSESGRGSTFKVLLPAVPGPADVLSKFEALPILWKGEGSILLVDDEVLVRETASRMLERLGFKVIQAVDGRDAVARFMEHSDQICCVLLDLTMPHMDGEECYRELRRIRNDVRVIMSSGYNEQDVTQRFLGKGLGGFIQKPYRMESLSRTLQNILVRP